MMIQRVSIVLLLLLAACGRESGTPQADAPAPEATPRAGGRLVVALSAEPRNLNPLLFTDAAAGFTFGMMHRSLVRMDRNLQWQPALADGWEWSADGLTLDVRLRPGLVWSDGQPFGPQDVVRSYELYRNPDLASPRQTMVTPVQEITVVDEQNLRMTFAGAGAELLRHLAVDPLPAHATAELDPAAVQDWPINRAPVTMGPFKLQSWTPNVRLVLERNPHYYGEPALLDEVEVKIVPDAATQVLQLESGEVDVVTDVPNTDLDRLDASDDVQLVPLVGRRINYMVLNLNNPLFGDPRVRQAISHAIDRRALVQGILDGRGQAGSSFLPPLLWCHHRGIEADAYDSEQAALLLTQAGWIDTNGNGTRDKGGIEFHFELTTGAGDVERENAAVLMRRNLEEIGLSMEIVLLEGSAQRQRATENDFDAMVLQLSSPTFADPGPFVRSDGRFNFGHYVNPEIDALLDEALATADRDAALPAWHRLQEILDEDKPMIVLYYPSQVVGLSTRVQDASPSLLSTFDGIETWWVTH